MEKLWHLLVNNNTNRPGLVKMRWLLVGVASV